MAHLGVGFCSAATPKMKPRIKMIIQYHDTSASSRAANDTTVYFYNDDGRITKIKNSYVGGIIFTYEPGRIIEKYYRPKNVIDVDTLILNKQGLVEKITHHKYPSYDSLIYDRDNHLIRELMYVHAGAGKDTLTFSRNFDYINGNQVHFSKEVIRYSGYMSSSDCSTCIDQYDDKRINTIGKENIGMSFLGSDSKNTLLPVDRGPKGMSCLGAYGGQDHYTYNYDAMGRIITQIDYDSDLRIPPIKIAYSYYSSIKIVLDK